MIPYRAFSHRHHISITPRHQGYDCRPCEVFQGGRNVFRVVQLDHFDRGVVQFGDLLDRQPFRRLRTMLECRKA
jgi:hypothetical protein